MSQAIDMGGHRPPNETPDLGNYLAGPGAQQQKQSKAYDKNM